MGRSIGLSCLLALVAACGGAAFSSGGLASPLDGSTSAVDASGSDGTTEDVSSGDVASPDAPATRDATRDRDIEGDSTTGSGDGAGGDGTADSGIIDSGADDVTSSDATPQDSGGGSTDAACAITCGVLCCPSTYKCCNGASAQPACVPKSSLCPL